MTPIVLDIQTNTSRELQRIAETAGARSMSSKEYRSDNKRVLLLGSGLVSEPVVEYLTRSADVRITIGQSFT